MDPRSQTSFIPKKPMVPSPGSNKTTAPINLFALIAGIFFVIALILTGGVFFYEQLTIKQLDANKQALEDAKAAYEPEVIRELIRLDARLNIGNTLLNNHVAVTPIFDLLSSITLKSIRFKQFDFSYLSQDKIEVEMKGQAPSYQAVALQSDLFNQQDALSNTVVDDLIVESTGSIGFSVKTTVSADFTSYAEQLESLMEVSEPAPDETSLDQTEQ